MRLRPNAEMFAHTWHRWAEESPANGRQKQWASLINKRNQPVLETIDRQLQRPHLIMVPETNPIRMAAITSTERPISPANSHQESTDQ